jgi:hypothetical protein
MCGVQHNDYLPRALENPSSAVTHYRGIVVYKSKSFLEKFNAGTWKFGIRDHLENFTLN